MPTIRDWGTNAGAAAPNGEVTRQAMMIAYLNDFRLMMYLKLLALPVLLLLRPPGRAERVKGRHPCRDCRSCR